MEIDIAIPSYNGLNTIDKCLKHLEIAIDNSNFKINRILIDQREDEEWEDMEYRTEVMAFCLNNGYSYCIYKGDRNLPEAREFLIDKITTEWFLFLDDDVYLSSNFFERVGPLATERVGAIQARKYKQDKQNYSYSKWRPIRATLFATLIKTDLVQGISIPSEVTVLEDEYIRQYIEQNNHLWIFNHQAWVTHNRQGRHTIDYNEGRIAGKYGLLPAWYIYGNMAKNMFTGSLTDYLKHQERAIGYTKGRINNMFRGKKYE